MKLFTILTVAVVVALSAFSIAEACGGMTTVAPPPFPGASTPPPALTSMTPPPSGGSSVPPTSGNPDTIVPGSSDPVAGSNPDGSNSSTPDPLRHVANFDEVIL